MEQNEKGNKSKKNWNVGIPIILWIACVVLGIIKVILRPIFSESETMNIMDILNAFNSNTFSTFISVVVCKLYQYFSTEKKGIKREKISGLSMKNIPAIFIISGVYIVIAVFDSAICHIAMSVVFCIANLFYIICFFAVFLAKQERQKDQKRGDMLC